MDRLEVRLRCVDPTAGRSSCYLFRPLEEVNCEEIRRRSSSSALARGPPSLPPLPLTHQLFRSPRLLNRHLRLNISPVGSVCSGGGKKKTEYSDRSNTGIRESTEKKYNLV